MSSSLDADDHEVVRVVGDGRRERAAVQAEAADEAEADAARGVVALDHGDLGQVARRVGDAVAVAHERRLHTRAGDELAGRISITRTRSGGRGCRRRPGRAHRVAQLGRGLGGPRARVRP